MLYKDTNYPLLERCKASQIIQTIERNTIEDEINNQIVRDFRYILIIEDGL